MGSAAGGGFPQWNCLCPVCRLAWDDDPRVTARSQSSIAATTDGVHWLLLNASPDLRQQIIAAPPLSPTAGATDDTRRASPFSAVLVTNGDVDHVAGLLTMREKQPFTLYGTAGVLGVIADNPIFSVLDPAFVTRLAVQPGEAFEPLPGLEAEIFSVPGKVPLYLETAEVDIGAEGEMTVGVRLSAGGKSAYYIPGCAFVPDHLIQRVTDGDVLLFDGTVFVDDEMERAGVGQKTGRRMGHMPMSGEGGSLNAFDAAGVKDRVYIHINNTNPVLIDGSPERAAAEAAGWRIAFDGMEIVP